MASPLSGPPFPVPAVGLMTRIGAQASQSFARKNNPIRTGGLEEKDNIEERSSSEKEKNPNRVGWSFRSGEEYMYVVGMQIGKSDLAGWRPAEF